MTGTLIVGPNPGLAWMLMWVGLGTGAFIGGVALLLVHLVPWLDRRLRQWQQDTQARFSILGLFATFLYFAFLYAMMPALNSILDGIIGNVGATEQLFLQLIPLFLILMGILGIVSFGTD